jgi:hypothetical protein
MLWLEGGASRSIGLTIDVPANALNQTIENCAWLDDRDEICVEVTVTVSPAELVFVKVGHGSGECYAGQACVFTLVVANQGGTEFSGEATITDILSDPGFVLESFTSPTGWSCQQGSGSAEIICTNPVLSLGTGASHAIDLEIDVPANAVGQTLRNCAMFDDLEGGCVEVTIVPSPSPDGENHFQCYLVEELEPFQDREVELRDHLVDTTTAVVQTRLFCDPADKNHEGIVDKDRHLACYELRDEVTVGTNVLISNQFGRRKLSISPARSLCVPSVKRIATRPFLPDRPVSPMGNHYLCYQAAEPAPLDRREVNVGGKRTILGRVQEFCTPVEKNNEGIADERYHLVCYDILRGPRPNVVVGASNQFGSFDLMMREAVRLCVPSRSDL